MTDRPAPARSDTVVVCLPDMPERAHMGDLPANVEVRLVSPEPAPLPELAEVDLVVPLRRRSWKPSPGHRGGCASSRR